MKLSEEQVIIPKEKITDYLLVEKEANDKSVFLFALGYNKEDWENLAKDILQIAVTNEIILERKSHFGNLYSIKGYLKERLIITIWLHQISKDVYRFITLYPYRE